MGQRIQSLHIKKRKIVLLSTKDLEGDGFAGNMRPWFQYSDRYERTLPCSGTPKREVVADSFWSDCADQLSHVAGPAGHDTFRSTHSGAIRFFSCRNIDDYFMRSLDLCCSPSSGRYIGQSFGSAYLSVRGLPRMVSRDHHDSFRRIFPEFHDCTAFYGSWPISGLVIQYRYDQQLVFSRTSS